VLQGGGNGNNLLHRGAQPCGVVLPINKLTHVRRGVVVPRWCVFGPLL
jgi:hypothetical protein